MHIVLQSPFLLILLASGLPESLISVNSRCVVSVLKLVPPSNQPVLFQHNVVFPHSELLICYLDQKQPRGENSSALVTQHMAELGCTDCNLTVDKCSLGDFNSIPATH